MRSKKERRKTVIKKLQREMEKDKTCPQRLSKWLKVIESKRKVFDLEDEIDKITKALRNR